MERSRNRSDGGVLSGLKSRLGFGDNSADNDLQDDYYDDYADDFGDEYGDAYDGAYDEFAEYGPDYDQNRTYTRYDAPDAVTTRAPRTSSRTSRSDSSFPPLVSINDVRARTRVPDSLNRDPLPARRASSASSASLRHGGARTVVDVSQPAPSSPAYMAAESAARESEPLRSAGLDSLFTSSAPNASTSSTSSTATSTTTSGFDPYEAYSGAGKSAHNPTRSLSVLTPTEYGDVERVAKTLKAGDVVLLSLKEAPDGLSKRVLDFSFGVASALDARVECVADKVFAITRDTSLTDAERNALKARGVL